MTLKHIDFFDSPVMRQLARNAAQKGTVKPSVAEIVKEAEARKAPSYEVTGDLLQDLAKLAHGLRERGYLKQAAKLEEKWILYKQAERAVLSDITDQAHPDGPAEMAESKNHLGVVETEVSRHEKILEVVEKQPTGKSASEVLTQKALNQVAAVFKSAQEAERTGVTTTAPAVPAGKNLPSPEEFGGDYGNDRDRAKQAYISKINAAVETGKKNLSAPIQEMANKINLENLVFSGQNILNGNKSYISTYAKYAGVSSSEVADYITKHKYAYGSGTTTAQTVFSNLKSVFSSAKVPGVKSFCDIIDPTIFPKYFQNFIATENPDQVSSSSYLADAVNFLGQNYMKGRDISNIDDILAQTANEVHGVLKTSRSNLFGSNLETANAGIRKVGEQVKSQVSSVASVANNLPLLGKDALSNAAAIESLKNVSKAALALTTDKNFQAALLDLQAFGSDPGISDFLSKTVVSLVDVAVAEVQAIPLNVADKVISVAEMQALSAALTNSGLILNQYVSGLPANDPKRESLKNSYAKVYQIVQAINESVKDAKNKPYRELFESLQVAVPQAVSFESLQRLVAVIQQNVAKVTNTTVTAAVTQAIEKTAQGADPIVPSAVPASPTASAVAPKSTPSSAGRMGLAKANMDNPDEAAVAYMQQQLAYFAEALSKAGKEKFQDFNPMDVTTIVRTGPKANPAVNTYDGKWGGQTQTALGVANKYLKQLGLGELDTKAKWNQTARSHASGTEAVAKNNGIALNQAIRTLGGATPEGESNAPYLRFKDNIYLYPADLASLKALYNFLVKNKILMERSQVNEEGGEVATGVLMKEYATVLSSLVQKARDIYQPEDAQSAKFYQAAINRQREFAAILSKYKLDGSSILSTAILPGSAFKTKPTAGGRGVPGQVGAGDTVGRGTGAPGPGMEGSNYESIEGEESNQPPIGKVLNFQTSWWNMMKSQFGDVLRNIPYLTYDTFSRWPVQDFINRFVTTKESAKYQGSQALRDMGAVANEDLSSISYQGQTKPLLVWWQDANFKQTYMRHLNARQNADPRAKALRFLNYLDKAINDVYGDWVSKANPSERLVVEVERNAMKWKEAIRLKRERMYE